LSPHGSVLASAGTGDRDGLVQECGVAAWPRGPVDGVLERAGDRAVVLRSHEKDCVGGVDTLAEVVDRLRLEVFEGGVEEGKLAEAVVELDLDTGRGDVGRRPGESRVERARPEAAGDREDPHRTYAIRVAAKYALSTTSFGSRKPPPGSGAFHWRPKS